MSRIAFGDYLSTGHRSEPTIYTFLGKTMVAIYSANVSPKNPQCSFRRWSLIISLTLLLLTPSHSRALPITLTLLVDGVVKTAQFAGTALTLTQIFGGFSGQSDDHPLYSDGASSPTLSISATETTFDLLLKQTNDVSEFEDDLPAVLSGVAKINTPTGPADAWKFSVTIEAEIESIVISPETTLDAQGFVQHIFSPHPELGEKSPAPALNYDLDIAVPCEGFPICSYGTALRSDSDSDKKSHNNGPHMDSLQSELEVDCCSSVVGNIDYFNVTLSAKHSETEPIAFLEVSATDLLTLDSDLDLGRNFEGFKVEIAGNGGPGYGHGQVSAQVIELGGTLFIDTDAGFSPVVPAQAGKTGDSFVILTGYHVGGKFDRIEGRHLGKGKFYEVETRNMNVTLNAFQALKGDADGNKTVDITDFNVLAANFDPNGMHPNDWSKADFDSNQTVDITDFNFLAANFTSGYGIGTASVPEPTTVVLIVLGLTVTGFSSRSLCGR